MKNNLPPGCTDIEPESLVEEIEREEMNFFDNIDRTYEREKEKSLWLVGAIWAINGLLAGIGITCFALA